MRWSRWLLRRGGARRKLVSDSRIHWSVRHTTRRRRGGNGERHVLTWSIIYGLTCHTVSHLGTSLAGHLHYTVTRIRCATIHLTRSSDHQSRCSHTTAGVNGLGTTTLEYETFFHVQIDFYPLSSTHVFSDSACRHRSPQNSTPQNEVYPLLRTYARRWPKGWLLGASMSIRLPQFRSIFGLTSDHLCSIARRTIVIETPIRRTDTTFDTNPTSNGKRTNSSADATSTAGIQSHSPKPN